MVTETYTWEWEEAFDKFGFDDGVAWFIPTR